MVQLNTTPCGLHHVPAVLTQDSTNRRCMGPRTNLHAVDRNPCPLQKLISDYPAGYFTELLHFMVLCYVYAFTSAKHIPPNKEHK
jgi:hypothetical protein